MTSWYHIEQGLGVGSISIHTIQWKFIKEKYLHQLVQLKKWAKARVCNPLGPTSLCKQSMCQSLASPMSTPASELLSHKHSPQGRRAQSGSAGRALSVLQIKAQRTGFMGLRLALEFLVCAVVPQLEYRWSLWTIAAAVRRGHFILCNICQETGENLSIQGFPAGLPRLEPQGKAWKV